MLALVVLALTAAPWAGGAAAKSGAFFGFNESALERGFSARQLLPLLDRTGATVYRMDVRWEYVEPRPGAWQWDGYDRMYSALRAGGIKPLVVARSAPSWARSGVSIACALGAPPDNCEGPPSPGHLDDWGEFVRRLAERYPDLAGVEVFNEPNYAINNWRPQADPEHYTAVLHAARAAVKSIRPRMPVVFGGLLNVDDGDIPENMSAQRFLSEAYAAGARGAMDAIAIHPYSYLYSGSPGDPGSPYRRMLGDVRRIRDGAGDGQTPLWITETGYHTGSPAIHGVTPEVQASRLAETVRLALAEPDVEAILVHSLIDRGSNPNELEDGFGIVRADLSPKPALAALAAITGAPRITLLAMRGRFRARARAPRPTLTIQLSEPARVAFTLARKVRRRSPYRVVQRFERALGAGSHRVRLPTGRRPKRPRVLRPGDYLVSARATDRTGERSAPSSVRFRVVR